MAKYKQGFFRPLNPQKYKGDPTQIIYRSDWERVFMSIIDKNPNVLQWSSEEIKIRYRCPTDNKMHTYYPDFWLRKINDSDKKISEVLIEIKPKAQTVPPKPIQKGKKPTKRFLNEVFTWGKNSAKWSAAEKWCEERDMKFVIMTEDNLPLLKP